MSFQSVLHLAWWLMSWTSSRNEKIHINLFTFSICSDEPILFGMNWSEALLFWCTDIKHHMSADRLELSLRVRRNLVLRHVDLVSRSQFRFFGFLLDWCSGHVLLDSSDLSLLASNDWWNSNKGRGAVSICSHMIVSSFDWII